MTQNAQKKRRKGAKEIRSSNRLLADGALEFPFAPFAFLLRLLRFLFGLSHGWSGLFMTRCARRARRTACALLRSYRLRQVACRCDSPLRARSAAQTRPDTAGFPGSR